MHTHSGQLERWLGAEQVENVSRAMREFYWPVAVHGVPGNVLAMPGGDFTGTVRAGFEATAMDRAYDIGRRLWRGYRHACRPSGQLNAGFASISELINAVTVNNARQEMAFFKVGTAATAISNAMSLWRVGSHPAAGAAAAAAPGGTVPTSATTGAIVFTNPPSGTSHITTAQPMASIINNTLLLYDRIFAVAKTMSSSATEAVTGGKSVV